MLLFHLLLCQFDLQLQTQQIHDHVIYSQKTIHSMLYQPHFSKALS